MQHKRAPNLGAFLYLGAFFGHRKCKGNAEQTDPLAPVKQTVKRAEDYADFCLGAVDFPQDLSIFGLL
jgi:hypothetical protein